MTAGLYNFFAALLSWWISLSFIRTKPSVTAYNALTFAALCAVVSYLLERAGAEQYVYLAQTAVFLFAAMAAQMQLRGSCGDTVIALLLAQSANAVLLTASRAFLPENRPGGLLPALVLAVVLVLLTLNLRSRFPETQWREHYGHTGPEPGRIHLRLWHVYLVPFAMCAILTALEFFSRPASLRDTLLLSAACAAIFCLGLLLLVLMHTYKKERATLLLEQQYRREMQVFLNVIRSQRHDYNFHVQTIAGLIQSGKLEECRNYVRELERDASIMNAALPLQDAAISAMINNFHALAARAGVELHIDIQNDLSQISCNVYETNKIISNLLQNALDEVQGHADKRYGIWLCILKRGEYCVIRVSNKLERGAPSAEELGLIYTQGYTTKQGHEGVGLSSIRSLAALYRGTIYTELEDDIIHFVAKIPISYAQTGTAE